MKMLKSSSEQYLSKYHIVVPFLFFLLTGCANKPVDLEISNKYKVSNLSGISRVIKSGDFIALTGANGLKLAITENLTLGFDIGKNVNSKLFFDQLFQETEDPQTVFGKYVREFRAGLLFEGFSEKKQRIKNGSTVYIWLNKNNKLVAIVNDHSSEYFLNIVGKNVNVKSIENIIKE